ncbi:MAG TPA: hypothetical protein DCL44_09320 [Elusimicrobia bacterium]|nr:hypothetical protein [Elusimicrobiota bacterium]
MGSTFTDKYKRKSLLAALLLLFKGRAKYVSISLLMAIASLPFVVSSETIDRMLEFPPVVSFLRSVGMGGVISAINPRYSTAGLKAVLDKAALDSRRDSFWKKFFSSINTTLPPADSPSSMAMIRGGYDIGPPILKDVRSGGPVKGVVNAEERARGDDGSVVNLEGLLSDIGTNGDSMGGNFADLSPALNRTLVSKGGGVGDKSEGMYSHAFTQAGSKIPVPGSPKKVTGRRMGKVSGFSWKNVGYKTQNAKVNGQLKNKKPLFQLAETFAMTGSAFKSKNSAFEYQAAYEGSTYDGNDVNEDIITTVGDTTIPPDTGFAGDLLDGGKGLGDLAKECTDAQGVQGKNMSDDAKAIDDISHTLGSPPKCCKHGAVDSWNGKMDNMMVYCVDFNANATILSSKCQGADQQMDCAQYGSYKISKCSKVKCWLGIILSILLVIIGAIMCFIPGFQGIGLGLIISGLSMLIGGLIGGTLGALISLLGGAIGGFIAGGLAGLALSVAMGIVGDKVLPKSDDGSTGLS